MAKWSFPVLSGHSLHCLLVLDAIQAWTLVSKSGNAFQQGLENAFPGTGTIEWLLHKAAIADA